MDARGCRPMQGHAELPRDAHCAGGRSWDSSSTGTTQRCFRPETNTVTRAKTPQKALSQFPSTPSPKWGPGSAPQPQPPLPPAAGPHPAGCAGRPRRAPGQITANPRQIWSSGGKTTLNGRQVGSRRPQGWDDRRGALLSLPPGHPTSTHPPWALLRAGPGRGTVLPKNRGALAGLSLAPRPDPHPRQRVGGQGCAGQWNWL